MIIYKATNVTNNKIYIGQTTLTLEARKSTHMRSMRYNKRNNRFLNALRKYEFIWEVIYEAKTLDELNEKEIYYIALFNSTNKDIGYNLKLGGLNGGLNSEETKRKIGEHTKKRFNDPEIKRRVLEGLRKGTETAKQKAKFFFEERKCACGTTFKVKPHSTKKYCSLQCAYFYPRKYPSENVLKYQQKLSQEKEFHHQKVRITVYEWLIENQELVLSIPRVELWKYLIELIQVNDIRSIMLSFKEKSSLKLYEKLLKIYAEPSDE